MRLLFLASLLILLSLLGACSEEGQHAQAPPPAEVDVAVPLKHRITEWEEFTGRFEAVNRVQVRARVTGYLTEKKFRDGQIVKRGDVLFVIDPRPFEYEVQRAEAQYAQAMKDYKRAGTLRKEQAIAHEELEHRLEELKVAEAALNEARLDLEFTRVTAPFSGKISDGFVDIGNLVRENDTVLTRIVSVDPIHFEFESSQDLLLKYLRLDRSGERESSDTAPNPIFIKLQDEDHYIHKGRMDFVDNVVDPGTGTIHGRALVENKDAIIYPGLFGRARLMGRANFEAILLPERAINTDQHRKFVYTVGAGNEVIRNYIRPGQILDNGLVIIEEGLQGHERVVVNGIQRIRAPGQTVTPVDTPLEWAEVETVPDVNSVPGLHAIMGTEMDNPQQAEAAAEESAE